VAPLRISSRRLRRTDHGRAALVDQCTAQINGEEPCQPHSAPALQRLLLLASCPAGTRAGLGSTLSSNGEELTRKCHRYRSCKQARTRSQIVCDKNPPSTRMSAPVTKLLAFELARKMTAPTSSRASPNRAMGVCAKIDLARSVGEPSSLKSNFR